MLDKLFRAADGVARLAVWAGGAMLLFAAFLVSTDVILRKLFSISFTGSDEVSGYLFAISTTWAFGFVLLHRGNVRIDAVYLFLPPRVRAVLDVLALLMLGGFIGFFAFRAWGALSTSWEMGARSTTPLQTPTALPQTFWVLGLVFFMLVWLVVLAGVLVRLSRGDLVGVNRIAGAPTLDEEVGEELGTTEAIVERRGAA